MTIEYKYLNIDTERLVSNEETLLKETGKSKFIRAIPYVENGDFKTLIAGATGYFTEEWAIEVYKNLTDYEIQKVRPETLTD